MTTQQIVDFLVPVLIGAYATIRAELAHHAATVPGPPPPVVNVHPAAAAPAPLADVLRLGDLAASDIWAELERRGWMLASQPYPPAPAAAAWQPVQQHPVGS